MFPPKVPPTWSISMALSTNNSAKGLKISQHSMKLALNDRVHTKNCNHFATTFQGPH